MTEEGAVSNVDTEDLIEKFDKLFEDNDGWIVSSKEGDQQKVVKIGNDSTIRDHTRAWVDVQQKEGDGATKADPFSELNPCPKLFIADVLRAEKKGKSFVFRNVSFRKVFICGTVLSAYLYKERHTIVVDDGTSTITCFLSYADYLSDKKSEIALQKAETDELFRENKDDPVFKAVYLMARNSLAHINQMPMSYEDIEIGSKVSLFGNVSEHLENRYLFATKMVKHQDGSDDWLRHLKQLFYLYEHVYE